MTTSAPEPFHICGHSRKAGFTLAEVLIASTIGAFIMIGVISSFIMMGKSQVNAYNYVGMEAQARRGLERFGEDVRMASYLTTTSPVRWPNEIQLTLPNAGDSSTTTVNYYYDSTAQTLSRTGPDPVTGAANTTTVLITNLLNCEFKRWQLGTSGPASNDAGTDQLQLRLTIQNTAVTAVTANNLVVSARYVLRNHKSGTTLP